MVWGHALWLLLAAQTLWPVWGQSVPKSPCPDVFWYEKDSSGNWHGRMSIPAPLPSNSWRTIVELNIDAILPTQNVGEVKLMENEYEVWRRINMRNNWPVQFYVSFPLSWPLPELRFISSNGNYICIGNVSRSFLTKVTLQYYMYPREAVPYQPQNQSANQQNMVMNNNQYVVPNTKNVGSYTVNPRTDLSARGLGYNDGSVQRQYDDSAIKDRIEQLYKNNTALPSYEPCPGVFQYQRGSYGEWYGKISVLNQYPILAIHLVVDIYVTADIAMITKGSLQPANDLNEEWKRIIRGEKFSVQYNLQFPVFKTQTPSTDPLPVVKSIVVNNNVLCTGQIPSYSLLVTLSYQHSIFSDRCTSSSLKCPYNIATSAIITNPASPGYATTPSTNEVTQTYPPTKQDKTTSLPTHEPTSQSYNPSSPTYEPESPKSTLTSTVAPTAQTYVTSPTPSQRTSEEYETPSPKQESTTQIYKSSSNTHQPTRHTYTPPTTTFVFTPQTFRPIPPGYQPPQTEEPPAIPKNTDAPITQTEESSSKIQCGTLVLKNIPLIAHGEDTFAGQWPWHAALYLYYKRDLKYRCGGSYVGTRTVITAAHCVTLKGEVQRAEDIIIYLGRHNLRDTQESGIQTKDVIKVAVNPTYNSTYGIGDIAVLILKQAVQITAIVRPVCVWSQHDRSPTDIVNQEGLVVGWGLDERDEPTETLMMVKMPVVSQQTCIWSDPNYFPMFTSNGTFCAGFRNGSSVCNGDSGGGMVFPKQLNDGTEVWVLRGIVSHSRLRNGYSNVCDTKSYIVFTDVVQYLDWLSDIII